MQQLDPRLLTLSIEVNGSVKTYSDLFITANGTKYANALQNDCEITIANLDRSTQDYILTQTTPYNLNYSPKLAIIRAGRQSYGTSLVYAGNIISSIVSQPPDVKITLKCLTGNFLKGSVISRNQPGTALLSRISAAIAQDCGNLQLNFQATDKQIANYSFGGAAIKQVELLGSLGNINAYIDDRTLVVKNNLIPLTGSLQTISAETGMIGIPEFTEQGIKVKFLFNNRTTLGGGIRVISNVYPAANGDYVIFKLGFELSNRETPFYYIAEAARRR